LKFWEDSEDKLDWLRQYGDFKQGILVHYTIARVIHLISAKQLQRCLLRGSIHLVSAFNTADKSNEIKAFPELLEMHSLRDCLVMVDAMA